MIKLNSLQPHVLKVVRDRGTETPHSGLYNDWDQSGTFLCRTCGLPLFRSESKFHSDCGWPSFEEELKGKVIIKIDPDGRRQEIVCARCQAHLGHVFYGEGYTSKNIRHCVNSVSLDFVPRPEVLDSEEAIFAGGCFWGLEYFIKVLPGVLQTEVGYTGGTKPYPSYEEVCLGRTGHYEAIRILYEPDKLSYQSLLKYFFEIHDPTQPDGQGPDKGQQYLSVIFYYDEAQKEISEALVDELKSQHFKVVTQLLPVTTFWPAEAYHQNYYGKNYKQPYCHRYVKRF